MFYPTKLQWTVIWITTVICLIGFLSGDPVPEAFIMPFTLIAGLFIWHVSGDYNKSQE
jgi:hypothetical protein